MNMYVCVYVWYESMCNYIYIYQLQIKGSSGCVVAEVHAVDVEDGISRSVHDV